MLLAPALLGLIVAAQVVELADVQVDGRTMFTLEKTHVRGEGGRAEVKSVYRDLKGDEALVLEAALSHDRPTHVSVVHGQAGLRAEVDITPGKVAFEITERGGAVKRTEEEVLGVVLVGPGLTGYLQSDEAWRRLTRGEPVPIKIAAWERASTYGFELVRSEASTEAKLVVLMRPTAWVVRAFVDEMRYTFDRATRRLERYEGPVGVKRVAADGRLSALDAVVVYRAPAPPAGP